MPVMWGLYACVIEPQYPPRTPELEGASLVGNAQLVYNTVGRIKCIFEPLYREGSPGGWCVVSPGLCTLPLADSNLLL